MASEIDRFDPKSSSFREHQDAFSRFLNQSYKEVTHTMVAEKRTRLLININDLRQVNAALTERFLTKPIDYIAPFHAALKVFVEDTMPHLVIDPSIEYSIGLEGSFGEHRVTPRELTSAHIGKMVQVEGIVTRCSVVRPKIVKSMHTRLSTKDEENPIMRSHFDQTSLTSLPNNMAYPTKDKDGNALTTEYGLSVYRDCQTVSIQEMPERSPAGLLPCSVDVIVEGSLCDSCKPGDRVVITGVFRPLTSKSGVDTTGVFRTVLIANNIEPLHKQLTSSSSSATDITSEDISNIKNVASRPDFFSLLANSVAPSVQGHPNIKKALLLLLLGGSEKNLANGTHIRGDINVLMVGDPSTAKSQLLRYVLNLAPLAINTTGRGSSGAGLTAAVVTDKDTGERRLEAGAMVLADRGVVCIDEFDKMSDNDRVAIHEVMEQQSVTIAKAGIHMSLNSRCSVIAAANPVYGQYDPSLKPHVNIGLQDSLLSRFDLLFIVLDTPDPELDLRIATRVLNNHRYKSQASFQDADDDNAKSTSTPVFQKYDRFLHASVTDGKKSNGQDEALPEILSIDFLRKYIRYAKEMVRPTLSEPSREYIARKYAELRQRSAVSGSGSSRNQDSRALPVTARSLETMIRLSTAHAKARLSSMVEESDCRLAYHLMSTSMDAALPPSARIASMDDEDEADEEKRGDSSDEDDDDDENGDQPDGHEDRKNLNPDTKKSRKKKEKTEDDKDKKDKKDKKLAQKSESSSQDNDKKVKTTTKSSQNDKLKSKTSKKQKYKVESDEESDSNPIEIDDDDDGDDDEELEELPVKRQRKTIQSYELSDDSDDEMTSKVKKVKTTPANSIATQDQQLREEAEQARLAFEKEMKESSGIVDDDEEKDRYNDDDQDSDDGLDIERPVLSPKENKRFMSFMSFFTKYIRTRGNEVSVEKDAFHQLLNSSLVDSSNEFSKQEIDKFIQCLAADGKILYANGTIYFV